MPGLHINAQIAKRQVVRQKEGIIMSQLWWEQKLLSKGQSPVPEVVIILASLVSRNSASGSICSQFALITLTQCQYWAPLRLSLRFAQQLMRLSPPCRQPARQRSKAFVMRRTTHSRSRIRILQPMFISTLDSTLRKWAELHSRSTAGSQSVPTRCP